MCINCTSKCMVDGLEGWWSDPVTIMKNQSLTFVIMDGLTRKVD